MDSPSSSSSSLSTMEANAPSSSSSSPSIGLQRIRNIFIDIPQCTKFMAAFLGFIYICTLIFQSTPHVIGLVPGYTLSPPYYFWNVITAGYLEESLITAVVTIISLLAFGKVLEPNWGTFELAKFIVGVNLATATATFFLVVILYGLSGDENLLYTYHYSGFSGALVALSVGVKQVNPEAELVASLRAKQIPGTAVGLLAFSVVLGVPPRHIVFGVFGLFFGWIYLRFFQKRGDTYGDFSEGFAFVSFFPEVLQPLAAIPINVLSTLLRLCFPCCRNKEDEPKVHTFIDPGAVSLSDPADAERRRQRALRVVDTRIAQLASTSSPPSSTGSSTTGSDSPPTLPSAAKIETV